MAEGFEPGATGEVGGGLSVSSAPTEPVQQPQQAQPAGTPQGQPAPTQQQATTPQTQGEPQQTPQEDKIPYPRFQEKVQQYNELKAKAEQQQEALNKLATIPGMKEFVSNYVNSQNQQVQPQMAPQPQTQNFNQTMQQPQMPQAPLPQQPLNPLTPQPQMVDPTNETLKTIQGKVEYLERLTADQQAGEQLAQANKWITDNGFDVDLNKPEDMQPVLDYVKRTNGAVDLIPAIMAIHGNKLIEQTRTKATQGPSSGEAGGTLTGAPEGFDMEKFVNRCRNY